MNVCSEALSNYFSKILFPQDPIHKLFKEWILLQEASCPVCDMYGNDSPFKCNCNERKLRQKDIEKKIKGII